MLTSVLTATCRRICRSVLTSMAGSRCTPTHTPLTKIFVVCNPPINPYSPPCPRGLLTSSPAGTMPEQAPCDGRCQEQALSCIGWA